MLMSQTVTGEEASSTWGVGGGQAGCERRVGTEGGSVRLVGKSIPHAHAYGMPTQMGAPFRPLAHLGKLLQVERGLTHESAR